MGEVETRGLGRSEFVLFSFSHALCCSDFDSLTRGRPSRSSISVSPGVLVRVCTIQSCPWRESTPGGTGPAWGDKHNNDNVQEAPKRPSPSSNELYRRRSIQDWIILTVDEAGPRRHNGLRPDDAGSLRSSCPHTPKSRQDAFAAGPSSTVTSSCSPAFPISVGIQPPLAPSTPPPRPYSI